jgi:hypothetical protein
MTSETDLRSRTLTHGSPNLGWVAVVFVILKMASLFPVTVFGIAAGFSPPFFPLPNASAAEIANYFVTHSFPVTLLSSLQWAAAIPLAIFTASAVSRLRFLGTTAAGPFIALFGGLMAAFDEATSASILWVLAHPAVAQNAALTQALHYLSFAFGGVGYSVPFGVLMAGICIPAAFLKVLPKWVIVLGLILAVIGELSWLNMLLPYPQLILLIPLTRFPGLVWLIAAGFNLPKTVAPATPPVISSRTVAVA